MTGTARGWTGSGHGLLLLLTVLTCLGGPVTCMLNIPWGPYIVPRSVRSGGSPETNSLSHSDEPCCPMGFKSEWTLDTDGKETIRRHCQADLSCCRGLKEVLRLKPNGLSYSVCVRDPNQVKPQDFSALARYLGIYGNMDAFRRKRR